MEILKYESDLPLPQNPFEIPDFNMLGFSKLLWFLSHHEMMEGKWKMLGCLNQETWSYQCNTLVVRFDCSNKEKQRKWKRNIMTSVIVCLQGKKYSKHTKKGKMWRMRPRRKQKGKKRRQKLGRYPPSGKKKFHLGTQEFPKIYSSPDS